MSQYSTPRQHFRSLFVYIRALSGQLIFIPQHIRENRGSINLSHKSILCMPGGGLNDILCTTLRFYKYSLRSSRTLYVGSKYSSVGSLDELFIGWPKAIKFLNGNCEPLFNSCSSVYPLRSKEYIESIDSDLGVFISGDLKEYITFDVRKRYNDDLLVHVGRGGGFGFDLLRRLRLNEPYRLHVVELLRSLPPHYESVQVRYTDILTNWQHLLDCIARNNSSLPLLVCSDSDLVIDAFKSRLSGPRKVFTLRTSCDVCDSMPIHYSNSKTQFERNVEMLSDLFAMAFSKKIYIARSADGISGFPRLALSLHLHKRSALKILNCNYSDLIQAAA